MKHATFALLLSLLLSLSLTAVARADIVGPGDMQFIGFNTDTPDSMAIVLLDDYTVGTTIHFTDNEWTGTSFSTGEGFFSWSHTSAISVGTVIVFSGVAASSPTASIGTAVDGPGAFDLAGGGDGVFAYLTGGAPTAPPTAFLAAIMTETDLPANFGTLAGTGLTLGSTAIDISGTGPLSTPDGGEYAGPRSGETDFSDYLAEIALVSNWTLEPTDGTLVLPFSTTPFTTVPEPGSMGLAGLLLAACWARARRRETA